MTPELAAGQSWTPPLICSAHASPTLANGSSILKGGREALEQATIHWVWPWPMTEIEYLVSSFKALEAQPQRRRADDVRPQANSPSICRGANR